MSQSKPVFAALCRQPAQWFSRLSALTAPLRHPPRSVRTLWQFSLLAALLTYNPVGQAQEGAVRFLDARVAAGKGDRNTLERLIAQSNGQPLDGYIEYWWLATQLPRSDDNSKQAIRSFLQREQGNYLAERLRSEWLRRLAKEMDWATLQAEFPKLVQPDQEARCLYLQARLNGPERSSALEDARPLWLNLTDPVEACQPVLKALVEEQKVDAEDGWWRLRRLFEVRRFNVARDFRLLPQPGLPEPSWLEIVTSQPLRWLDKAPVNFSIDRGQRELTLLALTRLAQDDPRDAYNRYVRWQDRFSVGERSYLLAQFGWQGAKRHIADANNWYKAAGDVVMNSDQRAWKIRAALRAMDWRAVKTAIEQIPTGERELPEWSYWYGRALQALGKKDDARRYFEPIAGKADFYSILATEELGKRFRMPSNTANDDTGKVERHLGVQRALALFRLDMRVEGTKEWNWSMRNQDDAFLLGAGRIAEKMGLYDRMIASADRTRDEHNYQMRYPIPWRQQIEPQAREQGLDPGWVYGLMRQESRFVTAAKSNVGAQGLMQVMPSTGKWVASKLGLKNFSMAMLQDPTQNVMLGTNYMRIILTGLERHPVLASAAYNAGPGRAKRWKDAKPLEGAIYAETIPFSETRDYVKKVMANSIVYGALFDGQVSSLKDKLGVISARTASEGDNLGAEPNAGIE